MRRIIEFLPNYLIEYIVYHEIVHLIERTHSKQFWNRIKKRYKEYREYEDELSGYLFLMKSQRLILGNK
jgi:predicted metal-dependent hydrolase